MSDVSTTVAGLEDAIELNEPGAGPTNALLHGWLKEVNLEERTAQLHDYPSSYVRLRFNEALDAEMSRLATQYVVIEGQGTFDAEGEWTAVDVSQITPGSENKPFDLEAFRNAPDPKVFDPDQIITASEPFDVDELIQFIRDIREDREL